MNKTIFCLIISFMFSSCNATKPNGNVDLLKDCFYEKDDYCFLKYFPQNFALFKSTFGWDETADTAMPLYRDANQYVDRFFKIIGSQKQAQWKQHIISLSYGGRWQADGVGYLRDQIVEFIKEKNAFMILNTLSPDSARSVLYFLFDGPHPRNDSTFFKKLSNGNQNILCKLFKDIFNNEISSDFLEIDTFKYFIRDFDINNDGMKDKILSSRPYQGNTLIVFLGTQDGYSKIFTGKNFSEDGGNIISDILPVGIGKGFRIVTSFPDRGLFEKYYLVVPEKEGLMLTAITYVTEATNKKGDSDYVCIVPQRIALSEEPFSVPVPLESQKPSFCVTKSSTSQETYSVLDADGFTNVREQANANSHIITQLLSGTSVNAIEKRGNWTFIETKDKFYGWIYSSKLKK